jgi:hypothetical protein
MRNRDPSAVPDCRGEDPLRHQVSGADVSAGCSRRARWPSPSRSSACSGILKNAGASPLNCRPVALRSICSALRRLSLRSLPASSVSECAGCVWRVAPRLSMPVATTETRTIPSRLSSKVTPTMMLASSSTSSRMRVAASHHWHKRRPVLFLHLLDTGRRKVTEFRHCHDVAKK